MVNTTVDERTPELRLDERTQKDVILDGIRNTLYNRLTAYFVVLEAIFISLGFATDVLAGSYSGQEDAAHVMAGIFGVFGILVAVVFFVIVATGILFTFRSALRMEA